MLGLDDLDVFNVLYVLDDLDDLAKKLSNILQKSKNPIHSNVSTDLKLLRSLQIILRLAYINPNASNQRHDCLST